MVPDGHDGSGNPNHGVRTELGRSDQLKHRRPRGAKSCGVQLLARAARDPVTKSPQDDEVYNRDEAVCSTSKNDRGASPDEVTGLPSRGQSRGILQKE